MVAEVKQGVFGVSDDQSLLNRTSPVYLALYKLPPTVINGNARHVREFEDLSPH